MKPGSVIVDLAGEAGGNCELTEPGETIVEPRREDRRAAEPAGEMPDHASQLYARNVAALLELMVGDEGALDAELGRRGDQGRLRSRATARSCTKAQRAPQERQPADGPTNRAHDLRAGVFVGFEVISKVPNTLHTPLMSGTNAIHGIVIVGGIIALAIAHGDTLGKVLAFIAIVFGTINVVGGFLVTDRMLEMFKQRPKPKRARTRGRDREAVTSLPLASFLQDEDFIQACYIVAVDPVHRRPARLSHPTTARSGNWIAAVGMVIAIVATLLEDEITDYALIAIGIALGTVIGIPSARSVKMTAMPQMVALFNGVGGGAVGADRVDRVPPLPARRARRATRPRSS